MAGETDDEVGGLTMSMTETKSRPTADAILARSEAEAHNVHAYALEQISILEHMIVQLKVNIEAKKVQREEANKGYVNAVDDAIRASRVMEEAVARIATAVDKT